ncbi:hypothetical protein Tco_0727450 [Tanacetum coccineum]|uniref:Uncharacterized protein n=1 Tax=Tanacetum coccineum TaxID=301880 RepID=A0ABQ4YIE0_9ASTR
METAKYGKIWYDEDIHDLRSVETEFPAIAFNDGVSSEKTLSSKPTVSSLNDEIDFKISFDDSDDEDYTVIFKKNSFSYKIISTNDLKTDSENDNEKVNMPSLPPPEPTVSCFDDLDFFKDFENEFSAIVYNNAQTSKSDLLTKPILSPQHIDKFNLKDETSLSEFDEEEQNVLNFNDVFPFNVIYPDDLKSDKDNDDDNDKIDIEKPSGDMIVIPLPNIINVNVGAYAHGSNKLLEKTGKEGLAECKASASSSDVFKSKTSSKKVKDYLNTYSSTGMDIRWINPIMSGTVPPIPPPLGTNTGNTGSLNHRVDTMPTNDTNNTTTTNAAQSEKVNGTFTRLKCLLNDLENNGVIIPQAEVNATFVNSLPRKWSSMNQTQRANNSIKNDSLATQYGKCNYEEGLIDQIYDDSDVEEDNRSSNEFLADLNVEFYERALLANKKRYYKRSGRVGSARNPMDKSKETCFACGKINALSKGKAEKGKCEKGLIAESFDWDEESVSSDDEGTTKIKAFMAITEDEPSVRKADARSGQWVEITIKKYTDSCL